MSDQARPGKAGRRTIDVGTLVVAGRSRLPRRMGRAGGVEVDPRCCRRASALPQMIRSAAARSAAYMKSCDLPRTSEARDYPLRTPPGARRDWGLPAIQWPSAPASLADGCVHHRHALHPGWEWCRAVRCTSTLLLLATHNTLGIAILARWRWYVWRCEPSKVRQPSLPIVSGSH